MKTLIILIICMLWGLPAHAFGIEAQRLIKPGLLAKAGSWKEIISTLSWNLTSHDYGSQNTGTNTDQSFTLTGANAEEISLAVTGTGCSLLSTTCGSNPFALDGTCSATVRFTPATAGSLPGSLTASWTNQTDKTVALSGTGVSADPYTTYFSNNFGCADSGTVNTCASPDAWTSETDTASLGAISSGAYVLAYNGVSTTTYIQKDSLTAHNDIQVSMDVSFSSVSTYSGAFANSYNGLVRFGSNNEFIIYYKTNASKQISGLMVSYRDPTYTYNESSYAFSWSAGSTYNIKIRFKNSTTTASADGSISVLIDGSTVASITGINTLSRSLSDGLRVGAPNTNTAVQTSITIDNFAVGYK